MQIQINPGDAGHDDALDARIENAIEDALSRFQDRVTRVEVHLHDDASQRAADDRRCVMEVRIAGQPPLAVEHSGNDLGEVVRQAAGKLERVVQSRLERLC